MYQDNAKGMAKSRTYSHSTVCPTCNGSGYILTDKATPDSIALYGDDIPIVYGEKCPTCNGGYAQRVSTAKRVADIPHAYYDKELKDFDWKLYKDAQGQIVNLEKQREYAESFVKDFSAWDEQGLGFYIWSRTKGSGKTFLASCLCNELIARHSIRSRFVSVGSLIDIARTKNEGSASRYDGDPIGLLCECKMLVLDDLGQKQSGVEWTNDILFRILDDRMQNKRVTIVTSNIKMSELSLDDRLVSRLHEMCQPLPLPEYDVRQRETTEKRLAFLRGVGLVKEGGSR